MKITLCIDKQDRNNPSSELRQHLIDIGCPLRSCGEFFDELKISTDDTNNLVGIIIRRCYVDKYGVLKNLDTEEIQELEIPAITLFEGTNYVYIKEFTNLNMKIEYLTNADMNKYFATKAEMNSTIKQTYDSIMLAVSEKADTKEVSAMIKMLADEIALRVVKGDVVNELNVSDELIKIIGNRLKIETDNFKLTEDGTMTAEGANFVGGNINLTSEGQESSVLTITDYENPECKWIQNARALYWRGVKGGLIEMINVLSTPAIEITADEDFIDAHTSYSLNINMVENGEIKTFISTAGITTPTITQTSLESQKKNIEPYSNALEEISKIDIYKYNLKSEKDQDKKHLGFIIGANYNYSHEITAANENGEEIGVDNYSMTSLCLQALKEQQEQIENLENKIKELEGDK